MHPLHRSAASYVLAGILLGVVSLALTAARTAGPGPLLDVLIAAATLVAGYAAAARAGHPAWSGASVGAAYGVVSGIGAFVRKVSMSELRMALRSVGKTSPISMARLLRIVNSPVAHVGSMLVSVLLFGLGGLLLGAIGGAIAARQRPGPSAR